MTVEDVPDSWPVTGSRHEYDGAVVSVRVDSLTSDGATFDREVVSHPGAVAIVAIDDDDRVLLVSQYRHAAGRRMVEFPAGLLDVEHELPVDAAKRELAEEGGIEASRWQRLIEYLPSPGFSSERVQVYLATGLAQVESPDGFTAEHEEATMSRDWVAFDELLAAVLAGAVQNGVTVVGSLALNHLRHEKDRSGAAARA